MGSVFGIVGSLAVAAIALGSVVAPITIELLGLAGAAAFAGSFLLIATMVTLPGARALDRTAAARLAELQPAVTAIGSLDIFEAASPAQLEALAAVAAREEVMPRTVVIREGDEPDDLFAIESGSVEVTKEGVEEPLATLGGGDYFGEIGLLHKRPRTATVTALTDAVLYRIPGDDFLRIANEGPRISTTLLAVVSNRLAASSPEDLGHA
jgi:CRP-like cAMP-binding protein